MNGLHSQIALSRTASRLAVCTTVQCTVYCIHEFVRPGFATLFNVAAGDNATTQQRIYYIGFFDKLKYKINKCPWESKMDFRHNMTVSGNVTGYNCFALKTVSD